MKPAGYKVFVGKKIGDEFVVLGKVNKIFIPVVQQKNNTFTYVSI